MTRGFEVIVFAALWCAVTVAQTRTDRVDSLRGVWRVAEITTTGANGATNGAPQPGIYIFTEGHYSFVRINGMTARPVMPVSGATAAQLKAVYDDGFVAHSGTYEVKNGMVTVHAIAGKTPVQMAPGNFATLSFSLTGNELTLKQLRNERGPVANPTTLKLLRVE